MNKNRHNTCNLRYGWSGLLCIAVLVLALALIGLQVFAANETYTVVEGADGTYHVEGDPNQTVQLLIAPLDWTITSVLTPEEDSYVYSGAIEGLDGNVFYGVPTGGSATVTMTAEGIWLPFGIYYGSDMAQTLDTYSVEGNTTTVGFRAAPTYLEESMLGMELTAELAQAAPDAEGVARTEGDYWFYRDETGFFYQMGRVGFSVSGAEGLTMEELFVRTSGLYGLAEGAPATDAPYYEARYKKEIQISFPQTHTHGGVIDAQVVYSYDGMTEYYPIEAVVSDSQSFTLDMTQAEGMDVEITVSLSPMVGVTQRQGAGFALTTLTYADPNTADPVVAQLTVAPAYSASKPQLSADGYQVTVAEYPEYLDDGSLVYRVEILPDGGAYTQGVSEIYLTITGIGQNVIVADRQGTGYRLSTSVPGYQSGTDPIWVSLEVEGKYTNTPILTAPYGYDVQQQGEGAPDGDYIYYEYTVAPQSGTFGADAAEIELTVSGLVPVTAAEQTGTGYRLTTERAAMLGSGDPLMVALTVEPEYRASVPALTLTSPTGGYLVGSPDMVDNADGGITYSYPVTAEAGVFPETETVTEFVFRVSGVGKTVSVAERQGTGYRLTMSSPSAQGSTEPIWVSLEVEAQYTDPPVVTASGYSVQQQGEGAADGDYIYYEYTVAPENGGAFGTDVTQIQLAVSGLVPVTAEQISGTGYSMAVLQGATLGSSTPLVVQLTVEPDYNASVPTLTLTEPQTGYSVGQPAVTDRPDGSVAYAYEITPAGGVFPETETVTTFRFRVEGIVLNEAEPTIRVENELDRGSHSSNTSLWPIHTVIEDGVSITTVTPEELEAMLDLAKRRGEEADKLPGDVLKEGIIVIEGDENQIDAYELQLTGQQFAALTRGGLDRLTVATPVGELSLYQAAMEQAEGENDRNGMVSMLLEQETYEGRAAVDATVTAGGKAVTEIEEPYGVRVFIPYVPGAQENVNELVAVYLPDRAEAVALSESMYDAQLGGMVLHVGHLSKFGVIYRPAAYPDVDADHWASPYITYLSSRNVMLGDSAGKFRPDSVVTRGEFVVMLVNALSEASLPDGVIQVYSDVPVSSYLAKVSNWMYYNNLDMGLSKGGKLRPYEPLTREELAAMLDNVSRGIGLRIRSRGLDAEYVDEADIAAFAKPAVLRLRAAGILDMTSNNKYNPKATITRGEVAKILAMLLQVL